MEISRQEIEYARELAAIRRAKKGIGVSKDIGKSSYLKDGGNPNGPAAEKAAGFRARIQQVRRAAEMARKEAGEGGVSFPWFIFSVALTNDLLDYLDPILIAATGGLWLGISETLGNVIDGGTWLILMVWSHLGGAKSSPFAKYLAALIIELIPFGDLVPSWTVMVLAHYFTEKAAGKVSATA